MLIFSCLIVLVSAVLSLGENESKYVIVSPKYLHSSRAYDLSFNFENVKAPIKLTASITGVEFKATKSLEITKAGLSQLKIDIPELKKGAYELSLEAEGGLQFKENKKLEYAKFEPIIAIQSLPELLANDKPINTFSFVVFFLDENLRPLEEVPRNTEILIYNADNRIYRDYKNVTLTHGAFYGNFELVRNSHLSLGKWRLEVLMDKTTGDVAFFNVLDSIKKRPSDQKARERQSKKSLLLNKKGALWKFENGITINDEDFKNGQSLKVNDNLKITITSKVPHTNFVYEVIGRGKILQQERKEFEEPQEKSVLELKVQHAMAPQSRLIIYFMTADGKVHYAETIINVEPTFENQPTCKLEYLPPTLTGMPNLLKSEIQTEFLKQTFSTTTFTGAIKPYSETTQANYEIDFDKLLNRLGGTNSKFFLDETTAFLVISNAVDFLQNKPKQPEWSTIKPPTQSMKSLSTSDNENYRWIQTVHNAPIWDASEAYYLAPTRMSYVTALCLAISKEKGFGYARAEVKENNNNLFIESEQPYSVAVDEIVRIRLKVKNIADFEQRVKVSIIITDEFKIVRKLRASVTKKLKLPSQQTVVFDFYVKIRKINFVTISFKIHAKEEEIYQTSFMVYDDNKHIETLNQLRLLGVNETGNFQIERPINMLAGTEKFTLTHYGGVLAPIFEFYKTRNVSPEKLRTQRSLTTAKATAKLSIWAELLAFIERIDVSLADFAELVYSAYENPLEIILSNWDSESGAFRNFLSHDSSFKEKSTLATAYVLSMLPRIKQNFLRFNKQTFNIDEVIEKSLKFLIKAQQSDGSFIEEEPPNIDERYQSKYAIAAKALLAFTENEHHSAIVSFEAKKKTENYLLDNYEKSELFGKSLALHALHKARYRSFTVKAIDKLTALSKSSQDGSYVWWVNEESEVDIEITALMLLNVLEIDGTDAILEKIGKPTIKWLIEYGGIYEEVDIFPTRAQEFATKAFSKYESLTITERKDSKNVRIDEHTNTEETKSLTIKEYINTVEKSDYELSPNTTSVTYYSGVNDVPATLTVFRFKSQWKLQTALQPTELPSFYISAEVKNYIPKNKGQNFDLNICATYAGVNEISKLCIISIKLPSGFEAKLEEIKGIANTHDIQAIYIEEKGSLLRVYISNLNLEQQECFKIAASRVYPVSLQGEHLVEIYEYDDYANRGITNYTIPNQACDVCQAGHNCLLPTYNCVS